MEWISVNERLPSFFENDVLVFMKDKRFMVTKTYNYGGKPNWEPGWRKGDRYEITHWAIPTPPEDK
jgi:hypothetical protein